jgi:Domain of unknown function (DUF4253)
MYDQQALIAVLQRHTLDSASLTRFAHFETGSAYRLTVKQGGDALAAWRTLRGLVDQTGYWPVIVSTCETFEDIATRGETPRSPHEIINNGLQLDWEQVLRQRVEQYQSAYGTPITAILPRGEWPEPDEIPPTSSELAERGASLSQEDIDRIREHVLREMAEHFQPAGGLPLREALERGESPEPVETPDNLAGKRSGNVYIALLPTVDGWQIPAYLNFGGWNWCPAPDEHVCLLKHWQEEYGADLMGMTSTTIELCVRRPPTDRESAITLAWEHYVYCHETIGYDLVTNTLEDLAARLLNGSLWRCWWD